MIGSKNSSVEHVFCSLVSQASVGSDQIAQRSMGRRGGTPNCACGKHQLTSLDPNLQGVWEDSLVRVCTEVMFLKRFQQCNIDEFAKTFWDLGCDVSLLNWLFQLTLLICVLLWFIVMSSARTQEYKNQKWVVTLGGQALWLFCLECHQKKWPEDVGKSTGAVGKTG